MRYRPEQVVALLDSERAGETEGGFPIVGSVDEALALGPTTALVGVVDRGRPLPAGLARAAEALHRGRPRRRERPARVHLRRSGAVGARGAPRRRAARPAQAARRPQRPDRREPDARRDDGADGRLRLCDREDDRLARARRGRPARAASPASSSRPGRPGSRSPAGASPSTRSSPTSSPARPSSSCSRASRAAASCCWVEGQGSLLHPKYSGVTLGLAPRLRAARVRALPHGRPGVRRRRRALPDAVARRARRAARARRRCSPGRRRSPRSRSTRARSTRTPRAPRSPRPRPRPACPADDVVRFGADRLAGCCA